MAALFPQDPRRVTYESLEEAISQFPKEKVVKDITLHPAMAKQLLDSIPKANGPSALDRYPESNSLYILEALDAVAFRQNAMAQIFGNAWFEIKSDARFEKHFMLVTYTDGSIRIIMLRAPASE